MRVVLDSISASNKKNILSYGLIVYSLADDSWCLVKKTHSIEFILIIKGLYRKSLLPFFFCKLFENEASYLVKMCKNLDFFVEMYHKFKMNSDNIRYALNMFKSVLKPNIESLVSYHSNKKVFWEFPKGRVSISEKSIETPIDCAIREFKEESSCDYLPEPVMLSNNCVHEIINTIFEIKIINNYWVYVVQNEFPLNNNIKHDDEISEKGWFINSKALDMIKHPSILINIRKKLK